MNKHTAFQIAMSLLIAAFLVLWPLIAGAQFTPVPRCAVQS